MPPRSGLTPSIWPWLAVIEWCSSPRLDRALAHGPQSLGEAPGLPRAHRRPDRHGCGGPGSGSDFRAQGGMRARASCPTGRLVQSRPRGGGEDRRVGDVAVGDRDVPVDRYRGIGARVGAGCGCDAVAVARHYELLDGAASPALVNDRGWLPVGDPGLLEHRSKVERSHDQHGPRRQRRSKHSKPIVFSHPRRDTNFASKTGTSDGTDDFRRGVDSSRMGQGVQGWTTELSVALV